MDAVGSPTRLNYFWVVVVGSTADVSVVAVSVLSVVVELLPALLSASSAAWSMASCDGTAFIQPLSSFSWKFAHSSGVHSVKPFDRASLNFGLSASVISRPDWYFFSRSRIGWSTPAHLSESSWISLLTEPSSIFVPAAIVGGVTRVSTVVSLPSPAFSSLLLPHAPSTSIEARAIPVMSESLRVMPEIVSLRIPASSRYYMG